MESDEEEYSSPLHNEASEYIRNTIQNNILLSGEEVYLILTEYEKLGIKDDLVILNDVPKGEDSIECKQPYQPKSFPYNS
jgi:hypothetical protein